MGIDKNEYWDDVVWDLRAFLNDNLNDPISGSRNSSDQLVWVGDTDAEIGSDNHKVPFITLLVDDGDNRSLGPRKMGRSDEYDATILARVIGELDHKKLASQAVSKVKDALADGTGVSPSGTYDGRSYDISKLNEIPGSDGIATNPQDRDEYRDDNYKERAFMFLFRSWYVD